MLRRKVSPPTGPQLRTSNGITLSISDRYLERGLHLYQQKKFAEALADLDEAIRNAPIFAELYVTRAAILYELERDDEATEDAEYALRLDPRQWIGHYVLGMIAIRRENFPQAVEYFSQAQRYAPTRPEIFFSRAIAFHQQDEMTLAYYDMDSALQVMKSDDKRRKDATKFVTQVKPAKKKK
ncbi:MAG: tetratricopeptide repeat protein [Chloroflexi bacterium]|nr:tetratricopeptide repeat protein [Chloroflexota bacterium]